MVNSAHARARTRQHMDNDNNTSVPNTEYEGSGDARHACSSHGSRRHSTFHGDATPCRRHARHHAARQPLGAGRWRIFTWSSVDRWSARLRARGPSSRRAMSASAQRGAVDDRHVRQVAAAELGAVRLAAHGLWRTDAGQAWQRRLKGRGGSRRVLDDDAIAEAIVHSAAGGTRRSGTVRQCAQGRDGRFSTHRFCW